MNTITISCKERTDVGKKSTKALRKEKQIPCVLYGGEGTLHFSTAHNAFKDILKTPEFQKIALELGGKTYQAFLKDAQFHPVTDELLHADLQELIEGRKIFTEIPIRLTGLAKGVRAGGKLMLKERTLKVKTLPKYLVNELVVDVTELELSKSIRVSDVNIEGVEFMLAGAIPIASVEITRALRSAAAAAAGEEEATEE